MAVKSSALAKCKLYTNDGMRNKIAHDADWNFNIFSYLNPFYRKMEKFVLLPFEHFAGAGEGVALHFNILMHTTAE